MAVAYGPPRAPRPSSLADVLDTILDKGIVIDAYVRLSLVGIEVLTVDARVVIASVDTYLRFAEATNRLELGGGESTEKRGLPETFGRMAQSGAEGKTHGAIAGAGQGLRDAFSGGQREEQPAGHR